MNPRRTFVLTLALLAVSGTASPHQMSVPFFRDDGSAIGESGPDTGAAAVITIWNTRSQATTMYLVYSQNSIGGAVIQQAVPFTIPARRAIRFRPVKDDPWEGLGRNVPNMMPGLGDFGSVTIYWEGGEETAGALIGRYNEFTSSRDMMHVLVDQ